MKIKLFITICISIILLLVASIMWLRHKRELAGRDRCLSVLRSTGSAIGQYCNDNNGNLPPSFSLLGKGCYLGDESWYICHVGSSKHGDWTNIKEWMDYIYIPWPGTTGVYEKYPVMYDRRLSNHGGRGINILLVAQAVRSAIPTAPESFHGQFFWDEGAQWLQKFAKDHPEYNIPLPDDLDKK